MWFYIKVDCQWSAWTMGDCSKACNGGKRTKTRIKVAEEQLGGECKGLSSVSEPCNEFGCPSNIKF